MKNNTYRRRSKTVSTVKKSHATIPAAWRRRNPRQVVLAHLGAGSSPWRRMVVRIAVAETHAKAQQLALDALIPQRGFSRARRTISPWRSASCGRRPCPRRGKIHDPAIRWRCQRSSVSGLTKKQDQRDRGSTRLIAASRARSVGSKPGPWNLATQDGELVAQHQDLQVLGGVATGQERERLDGAAQCEVGELCEHVGNLRSRVAEMHHISARSRTGCSAAMYEFAHPTGRTDALRFGRRGVPTSG